jgi:hypothetical protein
MRYTILCHETATDFACRNDPEQAGPDWADWSTNWASQAQAGVFEQGAGLLQPEAARPCACVPPGVSFRTVRLPR